MLGQKAGGGETIYFAPVIASPIRLNLIG